MEEETILEYEEYYLLKENIIYKISIEKTESEIFFKHKNYRINLNHKDLSLVMKTDFGSINEVYEYMIDKFEDNRIEIKKILKNKEMSLVIHYDDNKKIEIVLLFNKTNNDNQFWQLKREINKIKEENNKLQKEIDILKKYHEKNNPNNIKFLKDIVKDSYDHYGLVNAFIVFKSINDILYLIYATQNKSFISYDLINNKIIKEIKNYHNEYINNFSHYLDKINKRDLIISISSDDNNIRLWNVTNWECLANITNINKSGLLYSACFLNNNDHNYILTSNYNNDRTPENIKIFDFNSEKIGEIEDSDDNTLIIKTYYDGILSKTYIVTGNARYIKSYDCCNNKLYHKYDDTRFLDSYTYYHEDIIIKDINNKIKLIECYGDGNVRIWNFHSGIILKKIKITDDYISSICLWKDNYIFIGTNGKILLLELKNEIIAKTLEGHNNYCTIKKIIHPEYGECLISQSRKNSELKMWANI